MKLQHHMEVQKLRHYEDLESVEALIKSSTETIQMTKSEYLLSLRNLYHDNLLSLKEAKSAFHQQLSRLKKSHQNELSHIEAFAIGASVSKY